MAGEDEPLAEWTPGGNFIMTRLLSERRHAEGNADLDGAATVGGDRDEDRTGAVGLFGRLEDPDIGTGEKLENRVGPGLRDESFRQVQRLGLQIVLGQTGRRLIPPHDLRHEATLPFEDRDRGPRVPLGQRGGNRVTGERATVPLREEGLVLGEDVRDFVRGEGDPDSGGLRPRLRDGVDVSLNL
jgi:hypothetical protein